MSAPHPQLEARDLAVSLRADGRRVAALAGADLSLAAGEVVALVGVSGSGKSTLGRCLTGALRPDRGVVLLDGQPLVGRCPAIQCIAQDPASALPPRFTVAQAVAEPHRIAAGWWSGRRAGDEPLVTDALGEVGLDPSLAGRPVRTLSGGQRRRVALARALVAQPKVLILDESFAGLDLGARARILALLGTLRARHGLTCLLIDHDLELALHLADRVAVLDAGSVVEQGAPEALLAQPRHAATRALLAARLDVRGVPA